jgi:hypothetical protein
MKRKNELIIIIYNRGVVYVYTNIHYYIYEIISNLFIKKILVYIKFKVYLLIIELQIRLDEILFYLYANYIAIINNLF